MGFFVHVFMTDLCIPYMHSPQCDFTFTDKNNNWLILNKYHIMYNDGISQCQVALTVAPYERLWVHFLFLFFPFVLDRNYGIEIMWFKRFLQLQQTAWIWIFFFFLDNNLVTVFCQK